MGRHTNAASCSTSQKPISACRRRSTRPAASLLAALAVLDSIGSSVPVEASPLPPPFLDFLYPGFYKHPSPTNKSNRAPTGASRSPPARPGSAIADGTSNKNSQNNIDRELSKSQQNRLQKRQRPSGIEVAVKYEPRDEGWVEATSWNLHGRNGGSDATNYESAPGLEDIQNLDAVNIGATAEHLDLPVGWKQDRLNRHENYSPIIVTVFAVLLVCSIVLTIGLCRWRNRKLRRLRDLEQLERKAKYGEDFDSSGSSQGDSESSNEKTPPIPSKRQKARRIISGKSSAIRKSIAARLRRTHKSRPPLEEPRNVDEDTADTTYAVPSGIPSAAPPSDEQTPSVRNQTNEPMITPSISRSTSRTRPPSSQRSVSIHPETQISTNNTSADPPNPDPALPPAYPTTPPLTHVTREVKVPLSGREEDYDPRDLTGYVRSPNPAIRSSASQILPVMVTTDEDSTTEAPHPPVPSFEGSTVATTSRIAAGATRQAHVATDDKRVLERMRSMAGAPTFLPSASTAVLLSSQTEQTARAPTWDDIDSWHTEQEVERHGLFGSVAAGQSVSNASPFVGPSSSAGLSILPPPSMLRSSPMLHGDVTELRLGHVWTTGEGETSRALTPSAPALPPVPSAPFMEIEEDIMASAPPAWDDEAGDDSTGGTYASVPELDDLSSTEEAQARTVVTDSRSPPESRPVTSRRSRLSTSLHLPAAEGQCLPRYEP